MHHLGDAVQLQRRGMQIQGTQVFDGEASGGELPRASFDDVQRRHEAAAPDHVAEERPLPPFPQLFGDVNLED